MHFTQQQKSNLAQFLMIDGWECEIITDGSELLAYAESDGNRCSTVLARSGATYFNGNLVGSGERFCDLLSAWVCEKLAEQNIPEIPPGTMEAFDNLILRFTQRGGQ